MRVKQETVDHIPLIWVEPEAPERRHLVIWLPGFGGTKESVLPQLRSFAEDGMTALSFDPYQHGERRVEPQEELVRRVVGNIRNYFWPILTLTAEEVPRIIDWAVRRLQIDGSVMIGGISMGGDISVAAAGIDRRIRAAAACIATADWLRPGSHEPPGVPDTYARNCYDRANPLTHLERYAHAPYITFQCGDLDTQVPPDGAERFAAALGRLYPSVREHIEIVRHPGTAHQFTPAMFERCREWFRRHRAD
jgi:dienelactone hydrolase